MDKIAYTFGVSRLLLNVVSAYLWLSPKYRCITHNFQTAAAKGLVTGHFILTRTDGTQAHRKADVVSIVLRVSVNYKSHSLS